MPLNKRTLIILILTLLEQYFAIIFDDEDEHGIMHDTDISMAIGDVHAKNVYDDIKGSAYFGNYANCNERMYKYILDCLEEPVSRPRNINLSESFDENATRRRRACKISIANRILSFLHQLGEHTKVWDSAYENGWNPSSVSRDFKHVLIHFVNELDKWIRPMNDRQRRDAQIYENYPTVYSSIDGSMFKRRVTQCLPNTISRKDYYDHKSKHGESINVQAVATPTNFVTHLYTGAPGRMCDANASRYIAENEWDSSILSDSGYPKNDRRFVTPDDTMEHKQKRSHVERLFGNVKTDSRLVGDVYNRDSKFHPLSVRAAFIMNNMKKVFGPTHPQRFYYN